MPWWVTTGIVCVGVLVMMLVVLWALGRALPTGHVISVTLRLQRPPQEVWTALADTQGIPSWDTGVNRVERLPDRDGHEAWRWHMGRNRMVLETTRSEAPRLLVRTIGDEAKFFSGDWTYEVSPDGAGTALKLTEHGHVHVAIPRAMMRYLPVIADPSMYLKRHLVLLARKFGEEPRLEAGRFEAA